MKRLRAEEVRANKVRELNRLANGLFKSAWRLAVWLCVSFDSELYVTCDP